MDSLTQIVLGAAVGEAVLGRKAGNRAILWGAIAGTIPDLDVIPGKFMDTVNMLEFHRGPTHSILFSIIAAPVLGWLISKIPQNKVAGWKEWSWLMFWGFFTHFLLDCFTTWGTLIFWPFSDYKLAFQTIFVIDPLYTIPFMLLLLLAMFKKKDSSSRKKLNYAGLIISSLYLFVTMVNKQIMNDRLENIMQKKNISYIDYTTKPAPLNNILWNITARAEKGYYLAYHSFFDKSNQIPFYYFPRNEHLLGELRSNKKVQRLLHITEGYYTVEILNADTVVNDLRFGQSAGWEKGEGQFVFSYLIERKNQEVHITPRDNTIKDGKAMLGVLWDRMWGKIQ